MLMHCTCHTIVVIKQHVIEHSEVCQLTVGVRRWILNWILRNHEKIWCVLFFRYTVAWGSDCNAKNAVGLRFTDLGAWSITMCAKMLWNLCAKARKLWVKWSICIIWREWQWKSTNKRGQIPGLWRVFRNAETLWREQEFGICLVKEIDYTKGLVHFMTSLRRKGIHKA